MSRQPGSSRVGLTTSCNASATACSSPARAWNRAKTKTSMPGDAEVSPASERDGQRAQSAERQALAKLGRLGGERQLRQAPHERVDRDLSLETRQRRPQTEVNAPAERDVAVVAARDVEAV